MDHDSIMEMMMETIMEQELAIQASPRSKRDYELTLVSSGMRIIEVQEMEKTA